MALEPLTQRHTEEDSMVKDIRIRTTFIDENKTLRITIRGELTGTTGPKLLEALAGHQKKKPDHIELGFDEKCI